MLQSHVVSQVKKGMLCTFVKEDFWYRSCLPSSASTHCFFLVLYTQIFCLREWGSFEIDQYLKGQPPHRPSTYRCFRSVDWFWNCSWWSDLSTVQIQQRGFDYFISICHCGKGSFSINLHKTSRIYGSYNAKLPQIIQTWYRNRVSIIFLRERRKTFPTYIQLNCLAMALVKISYSNSPSRETTHFCLGITCNLHEKWY